MIIVYLEILQDPFYVFFADCQLTMKLILWNKLGCIVINYGHEGACLQKIIHEVVKISIALSGYMVINAYVTILLYLSLYFCDTDLGNIVLWIKLLS